jgi:anti-sigma regulatory factor (Ser/Thr protein kinase)
MWTRARAHAHARLDPPPLVAELSIRVAGGPDAPAEARSALRRFHPELAPELMQVVVLLASELVSNAVKHARALSIPIRCEVTPSHVRVEVSDGGKRFRPRMTELEPGQRGGWGLYLVDEMASRWGVSERDGKSVWFEIDR